MSTDVLGYLVEVIAGFSFDTFLEQRIFEPLGMVDTGFYVSQEKVGRFAAMYGPAEGGGLEIIDAPVSSVYSKPMRFLSGGSGLVSTASDYMRFAQMVLNGGELSGVRLLGPKTVELMTMNHLPHDLIPMQLGSWTLNGFGFGLGFAVLMNVAEFAAVGSEGSCGWGGAASTAFWVDPKEELIGLMMLQFRPSGHYPVRQEFRVLTYQAIVD